MQNNDLFGYSGKILRVSLNDQKIKKEVVDPDLMKKYLGGVGYAAKLLYDELSNEIDPLGEGNKLIFATGPLTGTQAPGSGNIEVCFKSPLTGGWAESRSGSDWGQNLKEAGYDLLIVEGRSDEPVYLMIEDGRVELKPAENLATKTTSEKFNVIRDELGDDEFEIAIIGNAGEKRVRYATIMFGWRAAGRCGAGAVMGSKNLLGIAVKGTGDIKIHDPDGFREVVVEAKKIVVNHPASTSFREHGTTGDLPACDETGDWPTKNWRSNSWGKGEELYDHFYEKNLISNKGCYTGCVMPCGRIVKVDSGKWKTPEHEGSEYESISAFTAFVLNDDMDAAVHGTYLCNEYGLDTISVGSAIAFAMDCYDQGIISKEDADGLNLSWGNTEAMIELVKKISKREGIGKILSEGVKRAAEEFGPEAKELAIHGKGLEAPAHDPRSGKALGVTYGTGNRGMCHIHPVEAMAFDKDKEDFGLSSFGVPDPNQVDRWDEKGKGSIVKVLQDGGVLTDILGTCKFYTYVGVHPEHYAKMMTKLTGWNLDGEDLLEVGERVINLQRMFNIREGFIRSDDKLPKRMESVPEFGQYADEPDCGISDFDLMLDEYYQTRGWNENGVPTKETLNRLGLGWLNT